MSKNLDEGEENPYSNHKTPNVRSNANYGQDSADMNSQAEINKLSSELNSRISREMDEMMSNVSSQIQRAINEAISTQVLPQIQNVMMAGPGRVTKRGWDIPVERPEINTEVQRSLNAKSNLRKKQDEDHQVDEFPNRNVHDMVTRVGLVAKEPSGGKMLARCWCAS